VFAGGFDLAAVQAVCEPVLEEGDAAAEILASLGEKSLVAMEPRGDTHRYRMLETLRDYAREKLIASGELPAAAVKHCEHFFVLAKAVRHGLPTAEQGHWVERMETDLDNVRAAMALPLAGGIDPFIAVKLPVAMQTFWMLRGYASEGRAAVRAALALPAIQAADMAQAHALYVGAALAVSQSDYAEARRMLETCLALRRGLGNPVEIAATLSTLAAAQLQAGAAEAAVASEVEALALFRQLGDGPGEAIGLLHLAEFAFYRGLDDEGVAHAEQGLAVARTIGHREIEADCLLVRAELAFEANDSTLARQCLTQARQVCQDSGNKRGDARALCWLGKTNLADGSFSAARPELAAALRSSVELEMREEMLGCLEDVAALAAFSGEPLFAARLLGGAAAARAQRSLIRAPRAERRWDQLLQAMRDELDEDSFSDAYATGSRWGLDEAVATAQRFADGKAVAA